MYIACYNGNDQVVQLLLEHGVKVDVPDEVSDISCIHVKLYNKTEVNEGTLSHRKFTKMKNDVYVFSYVFNYEISIQHITL